MSQYVHENIFYTIQNVDSLFIQKLLFDNGT